MYFIKCKNCGHLNKAISETLLFCEKCNKKLDNNFRDWKLRKPERTFEDFKLLMCISDADLNKKVKSKKRGSNVIFLLLSLVIVFVILLAVGYYNKGRIKDFILYGHPIRFKLEQTWHVEEYGLNGLKVETPFTLKPENLTFPNDIKAEIENSWNYIYWTSANFFTSITSVKFIPQIEAMLSIRKTVSDEIDKLRQQEGVTDFISKDERIYYNKIPGYKITGFFTKNKVKLEFIEVGYIDGVNSHVVFIAYDVDDDIAKKVAERIIRSIKIENNK